MRFQLPKQIQKQVKKPDLFSLGLFLSRKKHYISSSFVKNRLKQIMLVKSTLKKAIK